MNSNIEVIKKIGRRGKVRCSDSSKAFNNDPHRATFRGVKKESRNTAAAHELMGSSREESRLRRIM